MRLENMTPRFAHLVPRRPKLFFDQDIDLLVIRF